MRLLSPFKLALLIALVGACLVGNSPAATGAPTDTDTATAASAAQYDPGIVSYWKCDEGAGTTASDSVDANNGALDGATWTTGRVGNALRFDGDDRMVIPDSPSLSPSRITVETWVTFDRIAYGSGYSGTDSQVLISKGGDRTEGAYYLTQSGPTSSSSALNFSIGPCCESAPAGVSTPLMTLETNRWYHVAGTYDGSILDIYLDGVLQGSKDIGSTQVGNSSPLYFSYNDVGVYTYYLDGSLDEVAIFSRALTAPEIQRHYQNGLNNPVGGIAELPDPVGPARATAESSRGSSTPYAPIAGAAAGGALLLVAGGWYARRRWLA